MSQDIILRKASINDVKGIHAILLAAAGNGQLLPRPLSELYGHMREFYVLINQENKVVGCCALSIVWEDMAEIRSLIVREDYRMSGFGGKLLSACIDEAIIFGIKKLFTLTYQVDFFKKHNFDVISKDILPQKIWSVCIHCPKFPDCDETAMMRIL